MSQISKVLRDTTDNGLMFWCPGCKAAHRIQHGAGAGPHWTWNGDVDKPTFTPSVLITGGYREPPASMPGMHDKIKRGEVVQVERQCVCHSFVTDGRIQFLSDCTHALAGQTVELPEWPQRDYEL